MKCLLTDKIGLIRDLLGFFEKNSLEKKYVTENAAADHDIVHI